MRRALLVVAAFCGCAGAVVIDRMAVVIGDRVIKDSDIERDIRLTDFLNGDKLDLGAASRKKAAQRLIDQSMIRREVDLGRYPPPSDAEMNAFLQQVRKQRSPDNLPFEQALKAYGLTQAELDAQVRWQINVLHFIEQRFRPAVLVSDQEIETYYNAHRADFRDPKTGKVPEIYDVRDSIQDVLAAPKVNREFEGWLERARKRAKVTYREAALE